MIDTDDVLRILILLFAAVVAGAYFAATFFNRRVRDEMRGRR